MPAVFLYPFSTVTYYQKNCETILLNLLTKVYNCSIMKTIKGDKNPEAKGDTIMFINGKQMTAKELAREIPTEEEFRIHRRVELYYELEDIEAVLEEEFHEATIDDLTEDELNAIIERHEEYLEENAYDSVILAEIIKHTLDEYGNTTIER